MKILFMLSNVSLEWWILILILFVIVIPTSFYFLGYSHGKKLERMNQMKKDLEKKLRWFFWSVELLEYAFYISLKSIHFPYMYCWPLSYITKLQEASINQGEKERLWYFGRYQLAESQKLTPTRRCEIAEDDLKMWGNRAKGFFIDQENATNRNDFGLASFYLQQVVEMCYTAIEMGFTHYTPWA